MQNVKKSFRKTELALFLIGLIVGILIWIFPKEIWENICQRLTIGVLSQTKIIDSKVFVEHLKYLLLGYFFCFLAFTISYELFFLFEPNPKIRKWAYLFLTNLKLVIIGCLFYYVRLTGIPATNLVIGFIICQTLAVFVLAIYIYCSDERFKVSKTDSKDKIQY